MWCMPYFINQMLTLNNNFPQVYCASREIQVVAWLATLTTLIFVTVRLTNSLLSYHNFIMYH